MEDQVPTSKVTSTSWLELLLLVPVLVPASSVEAYPRWFEWRTGETGSTVILMVLQNIVLMAVKQMMSSDAVFCVSIYNFQCHVSLRIKVIHFVYQVSVLGELL